MLIVTGPEPIGHSTSQIFQTVYELLTTNEDVIADLSLPAKENLCQNMEEVFSKIQVSYEIVPDSYKVPIAMTLLVFEEGVRNTVSDVKISYSNMEVSDFPQVVRARIMHEATHAVRSALVRTANVDGVPKERRMMTTPQLSLPRPRPSTSWNVTPFMLAI